MRDGDWLIAARQTAGRGRQGRTWQSEQGNFFGSVHILLQETDPPSTLLSLLSALAVVEALAAVPPHYSAQLKWPNDIMLDDAKLGGILLERQEGRVVVGFGVNLAVAPDVPGRKTASLDPPVSPETFAPILAGAFGSLLRRWRSPDGIEWLLKAWQARATPKGTPLRVHDGTGRVLEGIFDGVDPDGALRLRTGEGVEIVRAGDVEL